jgi:hypothetical protein
MDKRRRRLEGKDEGGPTGRMVPEGPQIVEPIQEQPRVSDSLFNQFLTILLIYCLELI